MKERKHYKEILDTNLEWIANLKKNKGIVQNTASKEITCMEWMKPINKPWKNQASVAGETSEGGRHKIWTCRDEFAR